MPDDDVGNGNGQDSGQSVEEQAQQVKDYIRAQVKESFDSMAKDFKPESVSQPLTKTEQEKAQDELKSVLNPFIEPGLNEARFVSQDAKDYVDFYVNNPEAYEYKESVEKVFKTLADAGRATSRADILNYVIGQEYTKDKEKFIERIEVKKKESLQRATNAGDFGASALARAKSDETFANFESLSLEDMEKALDGVTF